MTRRISNKAILEAISGSGGIISTIATRLGLAWNTARLKIEADPELMQAYKDECERVLDTAEGTIIKSIMAGDTSDAKWLLARKGRRRGYGEALDVTSGGEKLPAPETMTPSEIAERVAALLKAKGNADGG